MPNSMDVSRTIVKNIGRAIIKKTPIKISGNGILMIDDSDMYYCYKNVVNGE